MRKQKLQVVITKICLIVFIMVITRHFLADERCNESKYDDDDTGSLCMDSNQQLQDCSLPAITSHQVKSAASRVHSGKGATSMKDDKAGDVAGDATGEDAAVGAGDATGEEREIERERERGAGVATDERPGDAAGDHAGIHEWSSKTPATFQYLPDTSSSTYVSLLRRLLVDKLQRHTDGFNHAVLLDLPKHPNKGDTAIAIGELNVLSELHIYVVHYDCQFCHDKNPYIKELGPDDMVVFAHGGGNLGTYLPNDVSRGKALTRYRDYKYVMLGQSSHIHYMKDAKYLRSVYSSHPDVTFMLRDLNSYRLCLQHLPSVNSVLTPDMAFGLGPIQRFFPATMDIIWIRRKDAEKINYKNEPAFPKNVTYLIQDWKEFDAPQGKNLMDDLYLQTFAGGFLFLQRAHVVVTDRLHGMIVSMILGLPVVVIDNKIHKISNYMETWTGGVDNVLLAKNSVDATMKAVNLLHRVKNIKNAAA